MQKLPEDAAATRVAALANLIEEDRRIADLALQQPLQQVLAEWIQFRAHQSRRSWLRNPLVNQPPNGAPVAAGGARDLAHRLPGPPQRLNVEPFFHPNQPRHLPAATDCCVRENR